MNILIATEPDDAHALSVKLALAELGYSCEFLFTADMPSLQTNSLYLTNKAFSWSINSKIMHENFEVVWWRRPRVPFIPNTIHQNDFDCVKKENMAFYDAVNLITAPKAWWINPYDSIKYANSKIYQLKHAPAFNLKIPPTLISNDPSNVKKFIKN